MEKLTNEQMLEFINQHREEIPNMVKNKFNEWDVEKQYNKIQYYIRLHKGAENNENWFVQRIIQLYNLKDATEADVQAVIEASTNYLTTIKERRKEEIQKKIEELQNALNQLGE